ncbi:hypothetical protein BV898_17346 [Hypsibius exemplaris]|uniref:Uncharacterized protein n=1 Tax=Hypsibius exemplaris TaxID=2072580 RepID=A0A9X6NGQ3_HYPEX|nr:hypothetical protein BV898_17346 [Hypsibius exemplaris]
MLRDATWYYVVLCGVICELLPPFGLLAQVRCLMVGHAVTQSVLGKKRIHIILEYCEGGNLYQYSKKEPHKMTEKYVLHLAEQVAKGIRYLHTRDPVIVYGDLKGKNILFQDTAFMQVKIADLDSFGMFKGSQTLRGFTKNPVGTPTHMSPEMLKICDELNSLSNMDERVGRRTDMYSFACLILELINMGQVPYTDKNKLSIAQNELSSLLAIRNVINKGGCPDVSILFSAPNALQYSRELQALLNQCLHSNPAERPDCHDLLACISYLKTGIRLYPRQSSCDADKRKQTQTNAAVLRDEDVWSYSSSFWHPELNETGNRRGHKMHAGADNNRADSQPITKLERGQSVASPDQSVYLTLQDDGDLVLYRKADNLVLWASNTYMQPSDHAIMQPDGDFVLYNKNHEKLWHSRTGCLNGCQEGAFLVLQNDGNLVIYDDRENWLWSTNTGWLSDRERYPCWTFDRTSVRDSRSKICCQCLSFRDPKP